MAYTWAQKKIKVDQYSKFICEGYLVEVIPDVSESNKNVFRVHIKSTHRTASRTHNIADFVESDYMKIDVTDVQVDDSDPICCTYKNIAFNIVFNVEFCGSNWKNGTCTKGNLQVSVASDR